MSQDLYSHFDSIHTLLPFKQNLAHTQVVRDEPGLQIIDTSVRVLFFRYESRMKYTTRPEKYAELKQMYGSFKEYLCTYRFRESGINTDVDVQLDIKFPRGPLGFFWSHIIKPVISRQLKNELHRIEIKIREIKAH